MEKKIIIAGFGGQGVLSLGQFIAYASMFEGKDVTWLPSYGPEMRGGTANCSVVVSDTSVASPIISRPDILIVMNKPSLDKFVDKVKTGGIIVVNSSLIADKVERSDVQTYYVDANDVALKAGNPKTANIVLFGALIKLSALISKTEGLAAVEKIFAKKPKVIPMNLVAFEMGYELF